jgi:hypothetical protein
MLMVIYLGILLGLSALIVWNMFEEQDVFFQFECALVLIPFILRLLLIK